MLFLITTGCQTVILQLRQLSTVLNNTINHEILCTKTTTLFQDKNAAFLPSPEVYGGDCAQKSMQTTAVEPEVECNSSNLSPSCFTLCGLMVC
jgi:hypothetical protein